MKPILFDSGETDFTSNGLGRLSDCTSCVVTEERNGAYELEMEYPITGVHYRDIQDSRIIYAPHDDTKKRQPFRIYKISKPISGIVTVNARHLTYDLSTIPVKPFSASSCVEALQGLKNNALTACPFEFWTDKSVTAKFSTSVPSSIRSILGGQEGSILDTYGTGEYEWDGYSVKFHLHRGTDSGVTVRYGKNMTYIEAEASSESAYDGVVPYWASQDEVVTLSTDPIIWKDGSGKTKAVPLDLSSNWQDKPTEGQLRSAAKSYVAARSTNALSQNIKIEFVQLWQTEEYKDVAPLQRVKLCDTVTVQHQGLGISATAKVISVKYNVLLERYDEMELGDAKQTLRDNVTAEIGAATKKLVTRSVLSGAISNASDLIRGGLGGNVVIGTDADGKPNEVLIMDTADKNTAVNVLRINKNGIGFSSTGYNGPFKSAWTIDGHFVADFIASGTIQAALIKAGILSDAKGLNSWNIETGELNLNIASTIGGKGIASTDEVAKVSDTANSAASAATDAKAAASAAQSDASSAKTAADSAISAADAAKSTADSAQSAADTAKSAADAAADAASTAQSGVSALYTNILLDGEGMHLAKVKEVDGKRVIDPNCKYQTLVSENGMRVTETSNGEVTLKAEGDTVEAANLVSRETLSVNADGYKLRWTKFHSSVDNEDGIGAYWSKT